MKTEYAPINWALDLVVKTWAVYSSETGDEQFSDESIRITEDLIQRLKGI